MNRVGVGSLPPPLPSPLRPSPPRLHPLEHRLSERSWLQCSHPQSSGAAQRGQDRADSDFQTFRRDGCAAPRGALASIRRSSGRLSIRLRLSFHILQSHGGAPRPRAEPSSSRVDMLVVPTAPTAGNRKAVSTAGAYPGTHQ